LRDGFRADEAAPLNRQQRAHSQRAPTPFIGPIILEVHVVTDLRCVTEDALSA